MSNKQEPKSDKESWGFILVIVLWTLFAIAFMTLQNSIIQQTRENYSIEGKILLNSLKEKQAFLSRPEWDLNEWQPIRNQYLENHYNLLLQYGDENLTSIVHDQELCLQSLADKQNFESLEEYSNKIDTCNLLGERIENRLMALIEKKVEGQ